MEIGLPDLHAREEYLACNPHLTFEPDSPCECMTEDLGDGFGERVVTHSMRCPLHPEYDEEA
jgi:hypothetical protein